MDTREDIRERLRARERELETAITRFERAALELGEDDVQDEIDRVTTSEAKTASLEIGTREFRSLEDVRAALDRLDAGTYGKCIVCGKDIEPSRLRAIPETPYCIEHARQAEAESHLAVE